MRLFVAVIEGQSVVVGRLRRAGGEFARPGKDGEVAVERAARAAEVREAEALNLALVVEVPSIAACVGAPLDHAERQ